MSAGQLPLAWAGHASERSRDCEAILARLRQGSATNEELQAICLGYRQRVSDLRAAGYVIDGKTGLYTLRNAGAAPAPSVEPDELPIFDGPVPDGAPAERPRNPPCAVPGCEFHGLPCAECGDGPFCVPCLASHYCGAPGAGRVFA